MRRGRFTEDDAQERHKGTAGQFSLNGNISSEVRLSAIIDSQKMLKEEDYNWLQLGPTCIPSGQTDTYDRVLVSGRITSILVHPTNPDIIYVGAAQGGVWKTKDGGRNWKATSDDAVSLAIGALAMDPEDPDVLYAGTGEGNLMASDPTSYYGCGLLKTIDGGVNWKLIPAGDENFDIPVGGANFDNPFKGTRFFKIAITISPYDADTKYIFVATSIGVYRSKDEGSTWTKIDLLKADTTAASDIVIDPNNNELVYAAFWGKGIYKLENAYSEKPEWMQLKIIDSEIPKGSNFPASPGRIVLDVYSKSKTILEKTYIYVLAINFDSSKYYFYKSENGGRNWTSIDLSTTDTQIRSLGKGGNYNLMIAVDRIDPNIVYLGATPLLKAIQNPTSNKWRIIDIGKNIHVDNHAFAFHPTDDNIIFSGNDGGIYKSKDGGATWDDSLNEGLCITQFVAIDQHPNSDAVMIGGTQDNGTLQFRNNSVFYLCAEGDGGYCAIDQEDPETVYHTYYGCTPCRSDAGGEFGEYENGGSWIMLAEDGGKVKKERPSDPIQHFKYTGDGRLFYPPFVVDQKNSRNLAIGTKGIYIYEQPEANFDYETKALDDKWKNVFKIPSQATADQLQLEDGEFSAINYVNSNLIYAGTTTGKVFVIKKSSDGWISTKINPEVKDGNSIKYWPNSDNSGNTLPINDITTFPEDDTKITVAFGGTRTSEAPIANLWRGQISNNGIVEWRHVSGYSGNPPIWRRQITDNGIIEWSHISGYSEIPSNASIPTLPTIAVNVIVIEPDKPNTMYIGTDVGVFQTQDDGKNWHKFGKGLPNCSVEDMRLFSYKNENRPPSKLLRAATHGRGLWEVELDQRTGKHDVDLYVRNHIMDTGRFIPSSGTEIPPFEDRLRNIAVDIDTATGRGNLKFDKDEFDKGYEHLHWWMCADIKVDTPYYQIDVEDVDYVKFEYRIKNKNLKEGCKNRIYVQIHNRGIKDADSVSIKLLYAKDVMEERDVKSEAFGPYLPDLPKNFWIDFYNNTADLGLWTQIGQIINLPDGPKTLTNVEPTILCWEWDLPIDASYPNINNINNNEPALNINKIGLLVVIDSFEDPIPKENKQLFNIQKLVKNEKRIGLRVLRLEKLDEQPNRLVRRAEKTKNNASLLRELSFTLCPNMYNDPTLPAYNKNKPTTGPNICNDPTLPGYNKNKPKILKYPTKQNGTLESTPNETTADS